MSDTVNHPAHYTQGKVEVITLTSRLGFCAGNVIKYILRSPYKGTPEEDLAKAKWYLNRIHKSTGTPQRQLLGSWAGILDLAGEFGSDAVTAVIDFCVNGSEPYYTSALREIEKLEKKYEQHDRRED